MDTEHNRQKVKRIVLLSISLAFLCCLILLVLAHCFMYRPIVRESKMMACSLDGECVEVELNITIHSRPGKISVATGCVVIDGIAYEQDNVDFRKKTFDIDYRKIPINANFTRIVDNKYQGFLHVNSLYPDSDYTLEPLHVMWGRSDDETPSYFRGVSFYGPAKNTEEALQIKQYFDKKYAQINMNS
ncbi:MAG: hypothetical protein IJC93_10940 [Clostridia bacterium]|nr:hypothetical protein [Clostridia bacterium]